MPAALPFNEMPPSEQWKFMSRHMYTLIDKLFGLGGLKGDSHLFCQVKLLLRPRDSLQTHRTLQVIRKVIS